MNFATIYPVMVTPLVYFISPFGTPLGFLFGDTLRAADVKAKVGESLQKMEEEKRARREGWAYDPNASIARNSSATQQHKPTVSAVPSTHAEAKARADQLRAKVKAMKEKEAKEKERELEIKRREEGKKMHENQRKLKEEQEKKKVKEARLEREKQKRADFEQREKLRRLIAQDKEERKKKREQSAHSADAGQTSNTNVGTSLPRGMSLRTEKEGPKHGRTESHTAKIAIRLLNGETLRETFEGRQTLQDVVAFVQQNRTDGSSGAPFTLTMTYPRR